MSYLCSTSADDMRVRRRLSWSLLSLAAVAILVLGWRMTEQQLAMRVAAQAEQDAIRRAELIVVSAPVALLMCGEDGRITVCSPRAQEMFGWERDELIGQPVSKLIPPELREEHAEKFQAAIARLRDKGEDWIISKGNFRTEGLHKDGHRIPVVMTIRMIRYGGRIEFITSMQPPKREPTVWESPLQQRAVQETLRPRPT